MRAPLRCPHTCRSSFGCFTAPVQAVRGTRGSQPLSTRIVCVPDDGVVCVPTCSHCVACAHHATMSCTVWLCPSVHASDAVTMSRIVWSCAYHMPTCAPAGIYSVGDHHPQPLLRFRPRQRGEHEVTATYVLLLTWPWQCPPSPHTHKFHDDPLTDQTRRSMIAPPTRLI